MEGVMKRIFWLRFFLIICIVSALLSSGGVVYAQEDDSQPLVQAGEILEQVCAGDSTFIEYNAVRVQGDLDFTLLPEYGCEDHEVSVLLKITDAFFETGLTTGTRETEVRFQKGLNLSGATFEGPVLVVNTTFEGLVNLDNAIFEQDARFGLSKFENAASFIGAQFHQRASFTDMAFHNVNFVLAEFHDATVVQDADFVEKADFTESRFLSGTKTFFNDSTFAETSFVEAEFNTNISFGNCEFIDAIDFSHARFNEGRGIDFDGSKIKEINITGISIDNGQLNLFGADLEGVTFVAHDFNPHWVTMSKGNYTPGDAYDIFVILEAEFRDQQRESLASEIIYVMRDIECDTAQRWSSLFFACLLAEPVGHFVRVERVLVLSGLVILICGVLYIALRARKEISRTARLRVPAANIAGQELQGNDLLIETTAASDDSQPNTHWTTTTLRCFLLSIAVFFSPRRIKTQTAWSQWWPREVLLPLLVWAEWILGWYLLIALAATLTGTYPPLRDLISSFR
jgi:uncharacterized protein YjbI with pentapeptide repeats